MSNLGFIPFRQDRIGRKSGGAVSHIHKSLNPRLVEHFSYDGFIECVACDCDVNGSILRIVNIYRSPNSPSNSISDLVTFLEKMLAAGHECVMVGDYNLPLFDWQHYSGLSSKNILYSAFTDFFLSNNLFQFVKKPTRGRNILDLVISNKSSLISNVIVSHPLAKTCDHDVVTFEINKVFSTSSDSAHNIGDYFDFGKTDRASFDIYLSGYDWVFMFDNNFTVDECYVHFLFVLYQGLFLFTPRRRAKRKKHSLPWLTADLKHLHNKICSAYRTNPDGVRGLNSCYQRELRKAQKTFEDGIIDNNNISRLYSYFNIHFKNRSAIPMLVSNGTTVSTDAEKANLFSTQFAESYNNKSYIPTSSHLAINDCLQDIFFTEFAVLLKLLGLKARSACGPDNIPNVLLKMFAVRFSLPISLLFNKCMISGTIPNIWKCANVAPIFKNGDPSLTGNYRPVSLTCIMCKIQESIVKDFLVEYLYHNELIPHNQFGFLSKRSCETQLLSCLIDFWEAFDEGQAVDVIYLDLSKAFDTVPINLLLSRLSDLNICGNVHTWLASFLSGRLFRVDVNSTFSDWRDVTSGVPQGSVLGPTLFIIFTLFLNDNITKAIAKYFADDTKLYKTILCRLDCVDLQSDLTSITKWFSENGLSVNPKKSMVLRIGKSDVDFEYKIGDSTISVVDVVKDLGVLVDSKLTFSQHCNSIASKCRKVVGMILKTFKSVDTRLRAYKTYVLPRLDYCSSAYNPYFIDDIENLEAIQHHFTKRILYHSKLGSASYEERLRKLSLASLESRRYERDLLMCHKIYHNAVDLDFSDFFTTSKNKRLPHHAITVTFVRSADAYRFCFARRVRAGWNGTPFDIVCGPISTYRNFLHHKSSELAKHLTSVVRRLGTIAT